ncbi:putative nuclease HARBI1 [Eriocheir sinensis]|uniref:putative nuclease HARBI1 n=1 Tax=Eriocheir sinensis TaxID=95602 RepID=UPI0021C745C1|nr:putative nuclease HARBI1 [Eriocheir sinensis]
MGRGCGIPLHLKMLVTLRYLATGNFLLTIADNLDMSKASAGKCVREVAHLISYLAPTYIQFPRPEEAHHVAQRFYDIAGMPGVIGCVDGTHIPIQSPGGDDVEVYRCRKGFYSLNVQGICDSDLMFTSIVASWPGSVHDARVFENSNECYNLEQGNYNGLYLLGDSGYPCREYLLTPLLTPRNEKERNYNISHAKTRNCVERAFGVLKRRFACLSIPLRTKLTNSKQIVMACVVLHNIAVSKKIELIDDEVLPQEDIEMGDVEFEQVVGGNRVRDRIVQRWF